MTEIMNSLKSLMGQEEYFWIVEVFLVVFFTMVFQIVAKRVIGQLEKQFSKTSNTWDDTVLEAIKRPASFLIMVLGFSFAAELVAPHAETNIFGIIEPLRQVLVIVLLAWFLVRLIHNGEKRFLEKDDPDNPTDETTVIAIGKLLRISVVITAALVVLQSLGYSVSGVLAFGGIGGIAVGFAAKDMLSNFFGALMIYMDRPFAVGDWVRSPDREIEGTVEMIGWRLTRIRTFDKRPLYVPNSVFASISVENPSRMKNRRIYETIGLRYEDAAKVDIIIRDVKAMLREHPEIDQNQTLIVNFNAFAASSLDFFVYTFTETTDWVRFHEIKQDVLLRIINIIYEHEADVAFPTSTVHMDGALINSIERQGAGV